MSGNTPDDRELERLASETAGLQQRYRESSLDEPSAAVDDAIRAAARREVSARPRLAGSPFSASWRIPLSIAAVVLVSATLTVLLVDRDAHLPVARDAERPVPGPRLDEARERDEPAPAPAQPAAKAAARTPESVAPALPSEKAKTAASNAAASADSERRARSAETEAQTREAGTIAAQPATASPPEPFPAETKPASTLAAPAASPDQSAAGGEASRPASPSGATPSPARVDVSRNAVAKMEAMREAPAVRTEAKDAGALRDERVTPQSPVRGFSEGAAPTAPGAEERATAGSLAKKQGASADSASEPSAKPWEQDPRAWLKHVEELRTSGRIEDAKASFKAFRSRYPDYPLPAGFVLPGA